MNAFRCLFVLVLVAVSTAPGYAQTRGTMQLGVSMSTLHGDTDSQFDPISRFTAGIGFGFDLRGGITLQPEFHYVVRGGVAHGDFEGVPLIATFDLTYLEFPLLVIYRFDSGGLVPFVFAGPSIAFNIDARVRYRAVSGGPEQEDTDDSIQDRDFGIAAGGGIEYPVGSETLAVGIRGFFGISNARDGDPPLRNAGAVLFVGLIF